VPDTAILETLAAATYVSLTTFRKNGDAVATPVWIARDANRLYVITEADSGKVKRLRNNPSVLLAPCDVRGRKTGEAFGGTATILEGERVAEVRHLMAGKYKLTYRVMLLGDRVRHRRSRSNRVGLEIAVNAVAQ